MITDPQAHRRLIAALHWESLFDAGHLEGIGDRSNQVACAQPATLYPKEQGAVRPRGRLASIESLAISARGLSIKTGAASALSIDDVTTARATANVAAWRTYLPTDCVAAMINQGWHRST
jgi:hypothetical protein